MNNKYWVIDGHCDSIADYISGKRNLLKETNSGHWDLSRAKKANLGLQFFASYIESEYKPFQAGWRGLELLDASHRFIEENPDEVFIFKEKNDIKKLGKSKIGVLLSVEGGEILGESIFMLDIIYRLGVRSLCLTWNERNAIGDGVGEERSNSNLSAFGFEVIRKMNNLGMIIDVSHLNEAGFWDILNFSEKPFIASHSCSKKLCNHPRNLSDKQLRALADKKGLIGINFCPDFLNESGKADINDVVKHICHIADIGGVDLIGFGSDFDGIDEIPKGLEGVQKFPNLIDKLINVGFSSKEIEKICHDNFIRVINDVLK